MPCGKHMIRHVCMSQTPLPVLTLVEPGPTVDVVAMLDVVEAVVVEAPPEPLLLLLDPCIEDDVVNPPCPVSAPPAPSLDDPDAHAAKATQADIEVRTRTSERFIANLQHAQLERRR